MRNRKIIPIVSMMVLVALVLTSMTSFASDNAEHLNEGDIIIGTTQKEEIVIEVNNDGSFTTMEFIQEEASNVYQSNCPHNELTKYRPTSSEKSSYNAKNSDKCYRSRTVDVSQCRRCGRLFYTYGRWSDYSHHYKFLGKKCTECGYEK